MIMLDHRCVTQLEHPGHSGVTRKPLREDRLEEMKPAPTKPAISIAVVNQVDARVGTIESVGDVEGSNKLVRLRVDFGDHKRTILAGMKQEREDPTEIEGRQALFIVNLALKVAPRCPPTHLLAP